MVTAAGRIGALVAAHPASYVAFDLLAAGGTDLREPAAVPAPRRARGRSPGTGRRRCSSPPPPPTRPRPAAGSTTSGPAGVEGLVAKGAGTRYAPGRREWLKVKSWETTEVLAGGVIGPIERPSQLVAGRYRDGELVVVGRTSPLSPAPVRRARPPSCTPADDDHPWPDRIGTGRFGGGRLSVPLTRVDPDVVVEVSADAALQAGVFRHPLRFVRVRPDLARRRPRSLTVAPIRRSRPRSAASVRPRRASTRRSSGAKTSSSIATPTTRIRMIDVMTSDIWDSSRPMLSSWPRPWPRLGEYVISSAAISERQANAQPWRRPPR